jgi:hypothetical protein
MKFFILMYRLYNSILVLYKYNNFPTKKFEWMLRNIRRKLRQIIIVILWLYKRLSQILSLILYSFSKYTIWKK